MLQIVHCPVIEACTYTYVIIFPAMLFLKNSICS